MVTSSDAGDLDTSPEHFLPISLHDLTDGLLERFQGSEREILNELCSTYVRLFHAGMRGELERLKRAYAPLRPDEDVLDLSRQTEAERLAGRKQFLEELRVVLRRANYVELPPEELDSALQRTSPTGLEVSVDLEQYEELVLFTRGRGMRRDQRRDWKRGFLKKVQTDTPIWRRLFLVISVEPDELYLKLFRDVPESDLEMLLPNTRVRIRVLDKIRLGVTGGGGAIGGAVSTVTKFSAAISPVTACIAIAGLAGVLWRQVANVVAQRTKYMATLQSRLYFHNLDNNQGALSHLVELAGEEECKEALLAYAFLHEAPCDRAQLDARVETYLRESYGLDVDYEVTDGLRKLRRAGLLVEADDRPLSVVSPDVALEKLVKAWIELGRQGVTSCSA